MLLLVTTSRSLLLLDADSGESTPLDRGHGLYYGIAHNVENLFVAARNRQVSSDFPQSEERGEILLFDHELQLRGSLQAPFPLRDLHEIAWHDGRLWATCSHDNLIAIYDGTAWTQWFPLGGDLDNSPGDINHFNSLQFDGDRVRVLAHNRGDSELLTFSIASRQLLERQNFGRCAHNVWQHGDQLFTCSSLDERVIGDREFILETGGFPRGMAFDGKLRYIGISAKADRKDRDFSHGKLVVFDGNWTALKEIALPGEGLILDIQILPEGFAHRQRANPVPIPDAVTASKTQTGFGAEHGDDDLFYRSYEDRNRGSRDLIKTRLRAYLPFLEPLTPTANHAPAIDLGCGRGEWLEVLQEAGFSAFGVDIDNGMLASCHERGLDVRREDALTALRALNAGSISVVSAFHVVEHIPFDSLRALVREALRVLIPGGLLILETPNPENLVVGATSFYQDPTHVRPIPPQLLRFVVEYEGFERKQIVRLQEAPSLHTDAEIDLMSVLGGASPDYAVVGQKQAAPQLLAAFDHVFAASYGVTLELIAERYQNQEKRHAAKLLAELYESTDQQVAAFNDWVVSAENRFTREDDRFQYLENRDAYLEKRIEDLENHSQLLGEQLLATLNSSSWRITAPLRWAGNQARQLREHGMAARLTALLKKIAAPILNLTYRFVDRRPRLRRYCANLIKISGLAPLLIRLQARWSAAQQMKDNAAGSVRPPDSDTMELPPRAQQIYRDLKTAIKEKKERS